MDASPCTPLSAQVYRLSRLARIESLTPTTAATPITPNLFRSWGSFILYPQHPTLPYGDRIVPSALEGLTAELHLVITNNKGLDPSILFSAAARVFDAGIIGPQVLWRIAVL